jgi:hypothetical protein
VSKGIFKILQKQPKVETPVLVNASGYSYYMVQLSDKRVAAIFNAYNGSFEELRIAEKPRSSRMLNPDEVIGRFKKEISVTNREVGEISKPVLLYDATIGTEGRFSPVWQFQTTIKQPNSTSIKKNLIIDMEGKIIKGF